MADSSNISEVGQWLDDLVAGIKFTLPGRDQSLGRDLAGIVVEGIADRSMDQRAADGSTWPENAEPYRTWKGKRYKVTLANVRTGQMLSHESLLGDTVISDDIVEMHYGIGEPPRSSATGADLSEADRSITDIEKAYFCSDARPFYELDKTIEDALVAEASKALDDYLQGH